MDSAFAISFDGVFCDYTLSFADSGMERKKSNASSSKTNAKLVIVSNIQNFSWLLSPPDYQRPGNDEGRKE